MKIDINILCPLCTERNRISMDKSKIRVLIVEDSKLFCEVLINALSKDRGIEVVGTASDPYSASKKLVQLQPDVMTLDIELPRMNGIKFLKQLMPQYSIPVVIVSGANKSVFQALDAGAVDFVRKPQIGTGGIESFVNELIIKIKIASISKVGKWKDSGYIQSNAGIMKLNIKNFIIAIGASTGGTEATYEILRHLSGNIPAILIVQHMPAVFTKMYAERLNNSCMLKIKEAEDGDMVVPGTVLIAPGEQHMTIKKLGGSYCVKCFKGDKVNGHCPSVDVLFNSVSEEVGKNSIGIILTGMGYDGAKGLLSMRKKGARTIGQDEESSVVYGMPKVAYETGAVEKQVSLVQIPELIYSLLDKV